MAEFPRIGKIDKRFFDEVIYPQLGASRPEVRVGPQHGVDNAVVELGGGKVMAVTTDPLSFIPALGLADSAWLSVHLLASDLATCGLPPTYAVLDFNLPPHMEAQDFERYWGAMHREFEALGVAVIGGHTGRYAGCDYTIIGGGTLIAVGSEDEVVMGNTARVGDRVIITKGAAIATTGLLARAFPNTVREAFDDALLERAQAFFYEFSVVDDALTAASVGSRNRGVTAMHDATEGGVLGALHELTTASGCGIRIEKEAIPVAEETAQICELFELDPYISLSEGTLVISARPERAPKIVDALLEKGISATVVGEMVPLEEGLALVETGGSHPLEGPGEDPYWQAFARAIDHGWR